MTPSASASASGLQFTYVTFNTASAAGPTITAAELLRVVTDLGLRPTNPCGGALVSHPYNGWQDWEPPLEAVGFDHATVLWVLPTPLAAPDWLPRLRATPGITQARQGAFISCSANAGHFGDGAPPPGHTVYLQPGQDGTLARLTFTAPPSTYDAALHVVADLGLRLANPCYEQAHPTPSWHTMGQEDAFAANHTLVVETTLDASDHWRDQLHATAGISTVEAPYMPTC